MKNKKYNTLPFGLSEFSRIRKNNCYFIDKSSYIKKVFEYSSSFILFARPRGFGKTLLLDMFSSFFSVARDGSSHREYKERLFDGLEISKDKEFIDKYMGQFCIICISPHIYSDSFSSAYSQLAYIIRNVAIDYEFVKDSPKLSNSEKESFKKLLSYQFITKESSRNYLINSLRILSNCIYKHFSKKVIILVDDYDMPLAKAYENGYHDEMLTLMSSFFNVMENNHQDTEGYENPIEKIILTGWLNADLSVANNISVDTILSDNQIFDSMLGFSKEETEKILKDHDLYEYFPLVKKNYGGYMFNEQEMFSPFNIISFVHDALMHKSQGYKVYAPNFWINSASSDALLPYVGYLIQNDTENMQKLMDGECIETTMNDSLNYADLAKPASNNFYALLYYLGYLTVDGNRTEEIAGEKKTIYKIRIPNLEIKHSFVQTIEEHFYNIVNQGENKATIVAKALFEENCECAKNNIFDLLQPYVSIRDKASKQKPKNFYKAFLSDVFKKCSTFISDFKTNCESDDICADLLFMDNCGNTGVIIEINVANSDRTLETTAFDALKQIEEKGFARSYISYPFLDSVYCYGISFYKRQCYISCKKIK